MGREPDWERQPQLHSPSFGAVVLGLSRDYMDLFSLHLYVITLCR